MKVLEKLSNTLNTLFQLWKEETFHNISTLILQSFLASGKSFSFHSFSMKIDPQRMSPFLASLPVLCRSLRCC